MDKLGYLGPNGTFSQKAANIWSDNRYELISFPSNTAVLKALENGQVDQVIVAIENVSGGGVIEVEDRLIEDAKNGRHFQITSELLLPIRHMLLAKKGAKVSKIKRVYSHSQAFAQCGLFIFEYNLEIIEVSSTAKAAEMIAESSDLSIGAIASIDAAEKYGLEVISENIGDRKDNATKFIVLGGLLSLPSGNDKTTIFLALRNNPGALHGALGGFHGRNINLSKISSRPLNDNGKPWEYIFLIDIDGHSSEEPLKGALGALKDFSERFWIIGSYPTTLIGG